MASSNLLSGPNLNHRLKTTLNRPSDAQSRMRVSKLRALRVAVGGAPSTVKHFRSEIRNRSGNALEMLSEQTLNSRFRTVGDPQTLEDKADSLPRLISEWCYPSTVGNLSFFGRAPSMEQPELVMKFLTALGAPLKQARVFASIGLKARYFMGNGSARAPFREELPKNGFGPPPHSWHVPPSI